MLESNDYYDILGISPNASLIQIKEAYIYKVNILHPDRLGAMPERIRIKAEEEIKKVNEAYTVLSSPGKKKQYDTRMFGGAVKADPQRTKRDLKPCVEVYPKVIRLRDGLPYVKQNDTFFVRNKGGPYSKVMINKTSEWITGLKTVPLQDNSKLPMAVNIEVMGIKWGGIYSSQVIIRLDESEAKVGVWLHMQRKPRKFLFW